MQSRKHGWIISIQHQTRLLSTKIDCWQRALRRFGIEIIMSKYNQAHHSCSEHSCGNNRTKNIESGTVILEKWKKVEFPYG